jgi:hypothetical protein
MKHFHQSRTIHLTICLSILSGWSSAQSVSAPDSNPASKARPALITIPAGTHLLMKLLSPLHTTSATPGSAVYLETAFPVVENEHVVIPEHTRVLGLVADERRPGRVKGRSHLRLQFTQLILPDDHELAIVGNLQSLPGSNKNRTVDRDGTVEPVDQIDADVYTIARTTGIGALGGAITQRSPAGLGYGALIGGGLGLAKVLFTRGDDISLPVGTKVEMVLQRPLVVQSNSTANSRIDNAQPTASNLPCLRDGKTLQCVDP